MICPVVPYPAVGGGHKRTLRLLEAMERSGAHPYIVTADDRNPEGAAELRARGWKLEVLPNPPPRLRSRLRQHLKRLPSPYLQSVALRVRELTTAGCAFVQVEHTQSAYYAREIGATRWILSLQNVDSQLARSLIEPERPLTAGWVRAYNRWHAMRCVERRAVPNADAVLCVSELDRMWLERLSPDVVVAPNGVDEEFLSISPTLPSEERILFFGQFDYPPNAQGIARFLREGWPQLAASRPDARLRLAGTGMNDDLLTLVEQCERVEPLGFVQDIHAEIADSRLVLAPIWSGGGTRLKVLESLAAARPLVGTPLGVEGIGVEHDRHAMIAATPAELARESVALLIETPRAQRLAAEGRRLAAAFRWTETLKPVEELYACWLEEASCDRRS